MRIESFRKGQAAAVLVRYYCQTIEFATRAVLVNVPSYLQVVSPDLDRICSIIFAYLVFQVVGFSGACLSNATFALACRITSFLPPLEPLTFNENNSTTESSFHKSPFTSIQLISLYYISYASIRVMVAFSQGIFQIALESIKDYPDACALLATGGVYTLRKAPIVFVPALLLEIGLILADPVCKSSDVFDSIGSTITVNNDMSTLMEAIKSHSTSFMCDYVGMRFITSQYGDIRRMLFGALVIMVLQLWQAALFQFPNWNAAIKDLPAFSRAISQLSVLALSITTTISTVLIFTVNVPLTPICVLLFGWTLWLFLFMPVLTNKYGESWAQRVNQVSLQIFAANLRLTFILVILIAFVVIALTSGMVQAQLDITFITFALPALYCSIFLLTSLLLQSGPKVIFWGSIVSLLGSFAIHFVAGSINPSTGQGSVLLVWGHLMSKIGQYFGDEDMQQDDDYEWEEIHNSILEDETVNEVIGNVSSENNHSIRQKYHDSSPPINYPLQHDCSDGNLDSGPTEEQTVTPEIKLFSPRLHSKLFSGINTQSAASHALSRRSLSRETLAGRGQDSSSLVSLGLPLNMTDHFLIKFCKTYLRFLYTIARALAVSDSTASGVIRGCVGMIVALAMITVLTAIGSFTQRRFQLFPRLLDIEIDRASGSFLFAHKISNVTLYYRNRTKPTLISTCSISEDVNAFNSDSTNTFMLPPYYSACDWSWHDSTAGMNRSSHINAQSLSLLDFALLSQLSYYDSNISEDVNRTSFQSALDALFPDLDLKFIPQSLKNDGAMYIELKSKLLNLNIIAVRGTDVGRLHDLLEDLKLYAEPVLFHLLSIAFPSIRLWTSDTTSRVIEWLYQVNTFLGLQSEAQYYKPLVSRILNITKESNCYSNDSKPNFKGSCSSRVVITGHSLGGGLARIVGALTNVATVTFSPPGFGSSYRKYAYIPTTDNSANESTEKVSTNRQTKRFISNKGNMHDNSIAVITEFDWITQIDHQVGLVQNILCDKPEQAMQNSCHVLEGTICHLLQHCGDKRRDRFESCEFDFELSSIASSFSLAHLQSSHVWILATIVALIIGLFALAIISEIL